MFSDDAKKSRVRTTLEGGKVSLSFHLCWVGVISHGLTLDNRPAHVVNLGWRLLHGFSLKLETKSQNFSLLS